jgi:hypothetical protein
MNKHEWKEAGWLLLQVIVFLIMFYGFIELLEVVENIAYE